MRAGQIDQRQQGPALVPCHPPLNLFEEQKQFFGLAAGEIDHHHLLPLMRNKRNPLIHMRSHSSAEQGAAVCPARTRTAPAFSTSTIAGNPAPGPHHPNAKTCVLEHCLHDLVHLTQCRVQSLRPIPAGLGHIRTPAPLAAHLLRHWPNDLASLDTPG